MQARRLVATLTIAISLVLTSGAAGKERTYGGSVQLTYWPLVLSTTATNVTHIVVRWDARCPGNEFIAFHGTLDGFAAVTQPASGAGFYNSRLTKHRFRAKLFGASDWGPGLHGEISGTLGGTVRRSDASGFLSGVVAYTGGDGLAHKCFIGPVKWHAEASPLVYAGTTDEDEPLVFRLKPDRTAIAETDVGWTTGGCRSGDVLDVADRLGRMPLGSRRLLDATPDTQLTYSDHTQTEWRYRLQGRFGPGAAEGTLAASARFVDPSGQESDYCPGSQHAWSAVET